MPLLPHLGFRLRRWSIVFLVCLPKAAGASDKLLSDYQVKAAYIYTFAKFVEWPSQSFENTSTPLRFCILNDRSFEVELDRMVKGKAVAGHAIEVVQVQDGIQARSCHVLFINSAQGRQARHTIEALRGTSVLTVGETSDFLAEGGVINFVIEDDRVQFQVNQKAANAAGLYISSRLLSVAKRVVG
jgi:hypothetical protein